jgi:hypothetical protein
MYTFFDISFYTQIRSISNQCIIKCILFMPSSGVAVTATIITHNPRVNGMQLYFSKLNVQMYLYFV